MARIHSFSGLRPYPARYRDCVKTSERVLRRILPKRKGRGGFRRGTQRVCFSRRTFARTFASSALRSTLGDDGLEFSHSLYRERFRNFAVSQLYPDCLIDLWCKAGRRSVSFPETLYRLCRIACPERFPVTAPSRHTSRPFTKTRLIPSAVNCGC
jgi:hypothetical protein